MAERSRAKVSRSVRKRFYRVGEAAGLTGVEAHVLRFWESEFSRLRPGKTRGGQRLYSPEDIETILRIKDLLYEQGFTIAGARRRLRAELASTPDGRQQPLVDVLEHARREVIAVLTMLEANDKQ